MSPKLERLLMAPSKDWEAIRKVFVRLRSGHHQHQYLCRMVAACPLGILDVLLQHLQKKQYYPDNDDDNDNDENPNRTHPTASSQNHHNRLHRLPQLMAALWTDILGDRSRTPPHHSTAGTAYGRPLPLQVHWRTFLVNLDQTCRRQEGGLFVVLAQAAAAATGGGGGGGVSSSSAVIQDLLIEWGLKKTDIDQVVLALSKTARIVQCQARPMHAPELVMKNNETGIRRRHVVRDEQWNQGGRLIMDPHKPTLPLLHYLVYNHVPPLIVLLAAMVAPQQLAQRDAWGNLPLHYANLSAQQAKNTSQWWKRCWDHKHGAGCEEEDGHYLPFSVPLQGSEAVRRQSPLLCSFVGSPYIQYSQLVPCATWRKIMLDSIFHTDQLRVNGEREFIPRTKWEEESESCHDQEYYDFNGENEDFDDEENDTCAQQEQQEQEQQPSSTLPPPNNNNPPKELDSMTLVHLLLHETSVPLLVWLYPLAVEQSCQVGRLPLQTYLLSLLDYRRELANQLHPPLPLNVGTKARPWEFIHDDLLVILQAYPQAIAAVDPMLQCLPVALPGWILSCRHEKNNGGTTTSHNNSNNHLTEDTTPNEEDNERRDGVHHHHQNQPRSSYHDTKIAAYAPPKIPDPIFDLTVLNATYVLLRQEPRVLQRCVKAQSTQQILTLQEQKCLQNWQAKLEQIARFETSTHDLESQMEWWQSANAKLLAELNEEQQQLMPPPSSKQGPSPPPKRASSLVAGKPSRKRPPTYDNNNGDDEETQTAAVATVVTFQKRGQTSPPSHSSVPAAVCGEEEDDRKPAAKPLKGKSSTANGQSAARQSNSQPLKKRAMK